MMNAQLIESSTRKIFCSLLLHSKPIRSPLGHFTLGGPLVFRLSFSASKFSAVPLSTCDFVHLVQKNTETNFSKAHLLLKAINRSFPKGTD